MEVTSLLLVWQKYEIPAELISKMFYFHSVSIPIINYISDPTHLGTDVDDDDVVGPKCADIIRLYSSKW